MDSELAELIAAHARTVVPPDRLPTPRPRDGQRHADWLAEVARLREQHDAMVIEGTRLFGGDTTRPAVAAVRYVDVPVDGAVLAARVYTPPGEAPFPALAFLHGGGWWMGGGAVGFDVNDPLCRALCAELGAVVVNVDYRLAPECPYPGQLEDAYQTVLWLAKESATVGADPDRIGVFGISSGANLAAALTLLARDRGGPLPRVQVLVAPALDAMASFPAMRADAATHAQKLLTRRLYTHGQADLTLPYISPVCAADLSGLPPAVITVNEFDPLREEGRDYAARLAAAGTPVTLLEYPMTHTLGLPADQARWRRDVLAATAAVL